MFAENVTPRKRQVNPEVSRRKSKKHYYSEKGKKWRKDNRDKLLAQQRRWRAENAAKFKQYLKDRYKARRAAGICQRCPAKVNRFVYCLECREELRERRTIRKERREDSNGKTTTTD